MRIISSKNTVLFPLGKQGENLAQKIIFCDPVAWTKEYGTGTVQLLNQRPGEDTPYPVAIAEEADGSYSWVVTAADTALAGQGKCELRYLSGDTVVKSRIWSTIVNDALGEPSDTPPESQQGWVDQVLAAGTSAQDAAKRAEAAAINQPYPNEETGTWWVWDAEAGAYKNTGISYGVGGGSVELDTTLKESGKAADAASVGDALSTLSEEITDCIKSPASAQVGQTIVVKAVDDEGKPTEWEAANAGSALKLIQDIELTENTVGIEITGLNAIASTLSIRIANTGSSCGSGLSICVNGVAMVGYGGTLACNNIERCEVRAWLWKNGRGKLNGRSIMANNGINAYSIDAPEIIESIYLTSPYNDGIDKYMQKGTKVKIYEGVFPNVP